MIFQTAVMKSRLSVAGPVAILSMKRLWGKPLLSDLLGCAVDPPRRRPGACQDFGAVIPATMHESSR